MILYKYKSLEPFEQVSDLLLTKRLYCPTPKELNDPLEGVLGIDVNASLATMASDDKFADALRFWATHDHRLSNHRMCSFSESPESLLMWSYYGAGHSGLCLELDVEEYARDIHKINYVDDIGVIDCSSVLSLLTHKLKVWSHEQEHRWISAENPQHKFLRASIRRVLIGAGIDMKYFRPLFDTCAIMKLPLEIASFSTTGRFATFPLKQGVRWDDIA